jgi:hypothetical protein
MSTDLHFLKDIIELIPAVVSLIGLLGSGLEMKGGALYTKDPWIIFLHQLKKHSHVPTRELVKIAMDLYSKLTPQMKEDLVRYHQVSPAIIQQLEDMYKRYAESRLPPLQRDEEFTKEVIMKAIKDRPLLDYPIYRTWGSKDVQWVQRVLPDGRVEWKIERIPTKNIVGEIPSESKRITMESRPMLEEPSNVLIESEKSEELPPSSKPTIEGLPIPPLIKMRPLDTEELKKLADEFEKLPQNTKDMLMEAYYTGRMNATFGKYGISPGNSRAYKEARSDYYKYLKLFQV